MPEIELTLYKISKLRFINKSRLKAGVYNFPDFLLIGPQRTGTSWLFKNMSNHPEIFMPYEKELFFFSRLINKSVKYYYSDRIEWYSSKFKPTLWNFVRLNISNLKSFRNIKSLNLNFKRIYSSNLKGEATTSYAAMDEALIKEIVILNPDIKIIMLLRHPVDRAWSHAKKDLLRDPKKSISEVDFRAFKKFYTSEYQIRCGQYINIISNWKKYIKDGNFLIDFFDNIIKNPSDLLLRIFKFLGVSNNPTYINSSLSRQIINPTGKVIMPETHKQLLIQLFQSEINKVNDKYGIDWK